jgi:hypothetical protein
MTGVKLQALCELWQGRLRLQDWSITAKFARYHELDEGNQGHIEWNIERRAARIAVLAEDEIVPGGIPVSTESIIVHELLHVHFRSVTPAKDSFEYTEFEQAINAVAEALVVGKVSGV